MIGIMQLFIIVRPKTFKNAIGGLIDAFKWTNIRRIEGMILFLYSGLSIALSAYSRCLSTNSLSIGGGPSDSFPRRKCETSGYLFRMTVYPYT